MEPLMSQRSESLAIEAVGFSFAYPPVGEGDAAAVGVGPVDWQVETGAFHLLVGTTGSGKTTLLRCLKPAIAPAGERAGALHVFGEPVRPDARGATADAGTVGYVFQSPENQLVCDSVWHELAFGLENLGVPQAEMRRRVAEVAHFFGIEPWFRRQVAELSGGQKQMVALSSVLAMRPRLLVLDEPTSQLDPVAAKNFLHALFRVNRELGITVVVATHAPELAAPYATAASELVDGRVRPIAVDAFAPRPLAVPPRTLRPVADPIVRVSDAYVRYGRGAEWVLRGCDFEAAAGRVHAVVGGNGSGKSTLLRLIAGVLSSERGRVRNACARQQALLPQDPKALFVCDTVADELREWQRMAGYAEADVIAALDRFGLAARASHHPYDLSGGQQQLLAFAKLMLTRPALLLLDEPTKGLDPAAKLALSRAIADAAAAGTAVVAATHDLPFAALVADEVTMLFDGESACTEPTPTFFTDNLFYRPVEDAFARRWLNCHPERSEAKPNAVEGSPRPSSAPRAAGANTPTEAAR